jgi:hypothetical protein
MRLVFYIIAALFLGGCAIKPSPLITERTDGAQLHTEYQRVHSAYAAKSITPAAHAALVADLDAMYADWQQIDQANTAGIDATASINAYATAAEKYQKDAAQYLPPTTQPATKPAGKRHA